MRVKVDSREQDKLPFQVTGNVSQVLTVGLPFGDYWAELESGQEIPIVFERKSIGDLYSTLTNEDNIRLHKEKIRKAKEVDCTLILIIEGTLSDVEEGAAYSRTEPQNLIKTVFTFMVKYELMPVFCVDRNEMMRFMLYTWEAFGRNFKTVKLEETS